MAAAISVLAPGCSTPRLYYETTVFQHAPLEATQGQRDALVAAVRGALGDRALHVAAGGSWQQVHPGAALAKADPAVLYAVMAVAEDDFLGAEADIVIRGPGKRRTPVTVLVALDGEVYASAGDAPPRKTRWSKSGGTLAAALAMLKPAERRLIADVRWRRAGRGPGAKGGQYAQKGCAAEILVYDWAYAADGFQFTGDPRRPRQSALRSVLHEVGHALHHQPSRKAWCSYERHRSRGEVAAANRSGARAQSLEGGGGPVIDAYLRALGDGQAPTIYGEESDEESFAEAFSIWKLDPAALQRALPQAHRWFAADGHLAAIR